MCCSNGPVNTLPGTKFAPDLGAMCETEGHESVPATKKVQGETDSMGCEYVHLCNECISKMQSHTTEGTCDWCHAYVSVLKPIRDMDEGQTGPVYYACQVCISAYYTRIHEECASDGTDDIEDFVGWDWQDEWD